MGEAGCAKLGHVELAQENRSGRLELCDHGRVVVWDKIVENRGARRGADAIGVELVFHGEGNAVQRAEILTSVQGLFRFPGGLQSLVAADCQVGVEPIVQKVDAVEI